MACDHEKVKKIFTHGRKGKSYLVCTYCNKVISKRDWNMERRMKMRNRRKYG